MKKITLLVCLVVTSLTMQAQITTPQPSPFSKMEQAVGLTDVSLEYSRPSMRERVVFGNLVPYDKIWRTGANQRTKITFSDDVTVGGQSLKAGTYAVLSKPAAKAWDVYFYTDYEGGGAPSEWDASKVAAKVNVPVIAMSIPVETFTMTFDDLTNNSAVLGILWEKTYVGIKFEVPTVEKAVASIESTMNGPSANDQYAAASYFQEEGKDLNKAKEWIDKAVALRPDAFWMMRRQSLIYAALGDKKGAISAAKKSLTSAEKAGNADYIKLNKDSLKEWGAK